MGNIPELARGGGSVIEFELHSRLDSLLQAAVASVRLCAKKPQKCPEITLSYNPKELFCEDPYRLQTIAMTPTRQEELNRAEKRYKKNLKISILPTHRLLSSSFYGSYLESYKVIPKRNNHGAYGYAVYPKPIDPSHSPSSYPSS